MCIFSLCSNTYCATARVWVSFWGCALFNSHFLFEERSTAQLRKQGMWSKAFLNPPQLQGGYNSTHLSIPLTSLEQSYLWLCENSENLGWKFILSSENSQVLEHTGLDKFCINSLCSSDHRQHTGRNELTHQMFRDWHIWNKSLEPQNG